MPHKLKHDEQTSCPLSLLKGHKDVNFVRAIYEVITVDFLLTNKMIKKDLEKKKVYKTRYTKSFVFKTCFTEFFIYIILEIDTILQLIGLLFL